MSERVITPPKDNKRAWDPEVTKVTIQPEPNKADHYKVYRDGIQIGFVFATLTQVDKDRFKSRPGQYSNLGKTRRMWVHQVIGQHPSHRWTQATRVGAIASLVEKTTTA